MSAKDFFNLQKYIRSHLLPKANLFDGNHFNYIEGILLSNIGQLEPYKTANIILPSGKTFIRPYFTPKDQQKIISTDLKLAQFNNQFLSYITPDYFLNFLSYFASFENKIYNNLSSNNILYNNQIKLHFSTNYIYTNEYSYQTKSLIKFPPLFFHYSNYQHSHVFADILDIIVNKDKRNVLHANVNLNTLITQSIDPFNSHFSKESIDYLIDNSFIYGKSYSNRHEFPFISAMINYFTLQEQIYHVKSSTVPLHHCLNNCHKFYANNSIKKVLNNEFTKLLKSNKQLQQRVLQRILKVYYNFYEIRPIIRKYLYENHKEFYKFFIHETLNSQNISNHYWQETNQKENINSKYYKLPRIDPIIIAGLFYYNKTDVIHHFLTASPNIINLIYKNINIKNKILTHKVYQEYVYDFKKSMEIKLFNKIKNEPYSIKFSPFIIDDMFLPILQNVREKKLNKELLEKDEIRTRKKI